ncbi:hypothetical protein BGZ83_004400 [Gryganskiella cystojenkinii]|nr:hypothetical protein BGZ83_004400 [Gryganskiella cystojenkinii]
MGLTGKGLNQQRQKDDIVRELMESLQEGQSANENVEGLEEKLRQHRSRHQRRYAAQEQFQVQLEPRWGIKQTRDLVDASAEESQLLATLSREKTKRLQARDKIEDLGSKLAGIDLARDVSSEADDLLQILRMPPSTLCRSFLDKSSLPSSLECKSIRDLQCEERFGGTSPSLVFSESDEPVSSSGNVPLSLDIKWGDNSATWERFQPTLLRNRYEHWVVQQELLDQNKTSGERSSSDILEELGFGGGATLSGHHDNKARGTKTLESVSRVDPREALNLLMTNLRSDAVMSSSELEVEGENSLDRYFSMDQLMEYQVPPSSRSAVSLFSLLAWSVGHPDAVVISDPSCNTDILRELDPDFIFEELDNVPIGAELLPGNPVATWARNYGILVDSWRQLSPTQQMQLMGHLAKMLAVIWEQFEVLDCTRSDVGVIQPSSTSLLDGARKRGTSLGVMDSLLALEQEFVQGSLTNDFSIALDPAPPYSSSSSTNSFAEESTLDEGQRMTTATDQSQENIHILPLDYQGRASPHPDDNHKDNFITMRQFDFSLDDLLINLGTRSISPPDRCPSQDIQIVEVTRWKVNSGEKQPASSNIDQESSLPSSVNKYQVQARSSSYPLVHLFSLPDIFCPVSLGGQDDSEESEGFAHKFVLLLAEHSTEAAEFLTDDVKVKEQKLYHRWMAEWHGRFLSTPNRLTKSRLISSNRLATAQETPSLEQPRRPQNDDFLSRSSDNQLESGARNAAEYRERLEFEATARFLEQMDEGKKVLMASATIAGSSSTISSTKTVSNQKEDMSWPGVQHLANQLGVGAQWLSSWAEPALGSNGVRFGKVEENTKKTIFNTMLARTSLPQGTVAQAVSAVNTVATATIPSSSDHHQSLTSSAEETDVRLRMRIHISRARDLAIKDRNGFSDPYVKLSIGGNKFTTKVIPKTLNPVWNEAFDIALETQSVPDKVSLVFWDKDWIGKDDFMGALNLAFDETTLWTDATPKHFDDPTNEARWYTLTTLPGKSTKISGEVEIKFGIIDTALAPHSPTSRQDCQIIWSTLLSGRNKLGLGQRQVQGFDKNTTISLAEIPMAAHDTDSLGRDLRQETYSPSPPSSISSTPTSTNNLHGIVFMEIVSATNLPKLHNVTRTGFDMDPFVVISVGKYIFRTKVVRHNLNPVWKAKLMFRVHHGEESFRIKYSLHDWDKMSGNDHVGMAFMDVNDLIQSEQANATEDGANEMRTYNLNIAIDPAIKIATGESTLTVHSKFVPYTTLRRRFWQGLAKSYQEEGRSGRYSKVLIQTMLESLGSTLSSKTVDSFFAPFNKDPELDELTMDELIERLERQVKLDDRAPDQRQTATPTKKYWFKKPSQQNPLEAGGTVDEREAAEEAEEDSELYLHLTRNKIPDESNPQALDIDEPSEADFDPQTSEDEHVIRISTCPFCHDASLGQKLETDVITHIAVCSGNDGFNMDKLILGNFVTEANAQRKWITKVVKSLGYGRYVVGRSNANIIVQDRANGAMLEEKMPTFIRLGIRLLYKSPANKISVGKILKEMSIKQGIKFNDPRSKRDIEPFIRFHNLESQMSDVLEPIQNFANFNEFFYRKLKANARTLASPGDDRVAVSVADCRMTCFQTISDATQFWIKGRQFTLGRLLGDENLAKKYDGGSLAIFRLAPQDYHRYHIPVKGVLSEPRPIDGEYYTVNPMAIRSYLDVYGENKRVVSTIQSKEFGTVAYVAIGAMMVGSIVLTTKGGQQVERMEEHGYFAFGGSTIVILYEPNSIQFDEDLVRSSKEQIEMLVKVGMRVGVSTRV